MAFGFPASYKKQFRFTSSRESARSAIVSALTFVDWEFQVLGPDSYQASVGGSGASFGEDVSISIFDPDIIQIESTCYVFQIFDWGKNKANVNEFIQGLAPSILGSNLRN